MSKIDFVRKQVALEDIPWRGLPVK